MAYFFKAKRSAKSPFVLNIDLSNHCNERCLFCRDIDGNIFNQNDSVEGKFVDKGLIDIEVYENVVRTLSPYLLLCIPYVNGEPFVYKKFDLALNILKENNVGSMIATNGILLNERNISVLLDGGLDLLKVHVSGFSQEVHQIEHPIGNVEDIKNNLRNLSNEIKNCDANILVVIDYIKYKHNVSEIDLFRKFSEDLGFIFNIRPGNPKGLESIGEVYRSNNNYQNVPCDWLWKVMTVNWNGDVFPCCDYVVWEGISRVDKVKNDSNVFEIWNNEYMRNMREVHKVKGRSPIKICSECNRKGVEFKV